MEAYSSEEANDAKAKKPDEFHRIGLTLLKIELNWSQAQVIWTEIGLVWVEFAMNLGSLDVL